MAKYLLITAIVISGLGLGQLSASGIGGLPDGTAMRGGDARWSGGRLAQSDDAVKECQKACAAKYRCNRIVGTPGLRNPDLIACKKDLQACNKACRE